MDKTTKVLNSLRTQPLPPSTPIATEMFIPNHSGDHSKGIVLRTPVNDSDIANKKYVDDAIAAGGIPDVIDAEQINLTQSADDDYITFTQGTTLNGSIKTRGDWLTFSSYGGHTDLRLGEFLFYDRDGASAGDGGAFVCDYDGAGSYVWNFDIVVGGAGIRTFYASANGLATSASVAASQNISAGGIFQCQLLDGYTGQLKDSASNVIADVTGGIITAVYY